MHLFWHPSCCYGTWMAKLQIESWGLVGNQPSSRPIKKVSGGKTDNERTPQTMHKILHQNKLNFPIKSCILRKFEEECNNSLKNSILGLQVFKICEIYNFKLYMYISGLFQNIRIYIWYHRKCTCILKKDRNQTKYYFLWHTFSDC